MALKVLPNIPKFRMVKKSQSLRQIPPVPHYSTLVLTVLPHHSQRYPVRHSADQQARRHAAHLLLAGRLPSRQWCTWRGSLPKQYVAFSLQSAAAKSTHSPCTKYSHTGRGLKGFRRVLSLAVRQQSRIRPEGPGARNWIMNELSDPV